jgi:pimeloyl-ACP methyl ester carboxylesterase
MISRFSSEKARVRFMAVYDDLLDWPVDHTEIDVFTPYGPTHVRRSGEGPPLVLLPGMSATSLMWQSCVEPLSARHTVYAVDTIGEAGRSEQTEPMPDGLSFAIWLDALLAGLDVDLAHLVGASRGGWLGMNAAAHRPERVARVTALDPGGFFRPGFSGWMFAGMAVMVAPAVIRARFADSPRYGAFAHEQHRRLVLAQFGFIRNRFVLSEFTDDEIRAIKVPTTVVLGGLSPLHDSAEVAARLRAVNPEIRVDVVPEIGHGPELLDSDFIVQRVIPVGDKEPDR